MPRQLWFFLAVLLTPFWTSASRADTVQTIFEAHQSVSPTDEEFTFNLAPVPAGQQVRLSLEARIEWASLAGSNPWLRVAVNGNMLVRQDLLNKKNDFKINSGHEMTWVNGDRWRILYSPDYESAIVNPKHQMAAPKDDPYHFVWDISRLVKPGVNTVKLFNLKVLPEPTTMHFRNARIEVGAPLPLINSDAPTPAPTGPLTRYIATGRKTVPMRVGLLDDGRLGLAVAGKQFAFTTRTSLPDGKWQGPRYTSPGKGPLVNGQARKVKWSTGPYDVQRQIKVFGDHVHIADTLTNRSKELIGVMVEHRLDYPTAPESLRVAGRVAELDETTAQNVPENPSVYAQWPDLGIGLIAEDDVFRVHNKSFNDDKGIGLADEQLGIPAGKSVTLEWNIYPVASAGGVKSDYWGFVNAVRRNWGSNFTVPGPFGFPPRFTEIKPASYYKDWVTSRGLKIVVGDIAMFPDRHYAFGTGLKDVPAWVAREKDWIAKVRATVPDVKVLAYFHAQASGEPGSEQKYTDSYLIGDKGEHIGINFSMPNPPYEYRVPIYLPTRENSYGKALWPYIDASLAMGVSGLYWDEMSYCVQPYVTPGPWDNHTVIIDPQTHAVTGKRTNAQLVMQPLQLDVVKYLRKRGKYLLANSQPMTRTMLRQKIVRFTETPNYGWLAKMHFGSPIGLANRDTAPTVADTTRHIRELLNNGALFYSDTIIQKDPPAWPFVSTMFPITPVEIREGMVLGSERIQTTRSGIFGWPDGAHAEVFVVAADGSRAPSSQVKEIVENGRARYEVRIPSDQFVVLVKKTGK